MPLPDRKKENTVGAISTRGASKDWPANRLRQKGSSAYQDRRPRQQANLNNTSPIPLDKELPGGAFNLIQPLSPFSFLNSFRKCGDNGMVTARVSPGANNMNGDTGKRPVRGQTTPTIPRTKQGPYVAPRLATNGRDARREERVISPRIERIEEDAISPNVTPRSAARRTRGSTSAQSTPDVTPLSTPANSRPASLISPSLDTRNIRASMPVRPALVRSPTDRDYGSSQFFLASDAPNQRSRSPGPQLKPACFVYANGQEEALSVDAGRQGRRKSRSPGRQQAADTSFQKRRMASRSPSTAPQNRPKARSSSQYAASSVRPKNIQPFPGPAQLPHPATQTQSPPTSAPTGDLSRPKTANDTSRTSPEPSHMAQLRTSPDLRILSRTIRGAAPRSKSPLKKFDVGSLTSPPQRKSSITDPPILQPIEDRKVSNPSSVDDDRKANMVKALPPLPGLASPLSPSSPTRPLIPTNAPLYSVPGSPTKRDSGELSTTIADARRERKILDLEISNSSLLAFNRSLEKEIRKLKSEVRRQRRLTSMSAFSEVSTIALSSIDHQQVDGPADLESESEQSDTASTLSEGHAAEQKARDERRLQRDFAKHKELLNDSREMNSSIKRCLDVTSMMIADAKKALATEVNLDDDIGGRVLHEDDGGGFFEARKGLLSPISEGDIKWNTNASIDVDLEADTTPHDNVDLV